MNNLAKHPKKQQRLARLIHRANRLGDRAGVLYERRRLILDRLRELGLPFNTIVEVDGRFWKIVKPRGNWVTYREVSLEEANQKEIAAFLSSAAETITTEVAA